jgi:hypothetical protein
VLQEELFLLGEFSEPWGAFGSCIEPLPLSRGTSFDFSFYVDFVLRFGFDSWLVVLIPFLHLLED